MNRITEQELLPVQIEERCCPVRVLTYGRTRAAAMEAFDIRSGLMDEGWICLESTRLVGDRYQEIYARPDIDFLSDKTENSTVST